MAVLFLTFWGTCILFPTVATLVYILYQQCTRIPFRHILAKYPVISVFLMTAVLTGEVISVVLLIFISWWYWAPFHGLLAILYDLLENIYLDLLPIFFNWAFFFGCYMSSYILNINPSSNIWRKYFLPFSRLAFSISWFSLLCRRSFKFDVASVIYFCSW